MSASSSVLPLLSPTLIGPVLSSTSSLSHCKNFSSLVCSSSLFSSNSSSGTSTISFSVTDSSLVSFNVKTATLSLSNLANSSNSLALYEILSIELDVSWVEAVDCSIPAAASSDTAAIRSEEHTSELQSRGHLVCRLLLE